MVARMNNNTDQIEARGRPRRACGCLFSRNVLAGIGEVSLRRILCNRFMEADDNVIDLLNLMCVKAPNII
jgi:hypothetical protein